MNNKLFSLPLTALALLLYPTAVQSQTLEEALSFAYQNNPTILAQRASLRATDENVAQALSGWRPTIAAVGNITPTKSKTKGSSGNPAYNATYGDTESSAVDYGVGIQISQSVFSGFRTISQTKAAENQVKAAAANLVATEEKVLSDAVTAYADVLQYQSILDLKISNENILKKELEQTNNRFKVGEVTATDVAQANSRYAAAIADRVKSSGDLQVAKAAYLNIIGEVPENLTEPDVAKELLPVSLDSAKELAAQYNPAVIAAEYNARSAWHNINTQKSDLLPDLTVSASARKDWNAPLQHYDTNQYQASANLTIPLYEAGVGYSKVRQAKHTANQYRILKEEAIKAAIDSATSAWESYTTAQASIASIDSQIEAAARALKGVRREALAGERTVLDVLNAENELLSAKVNLITAKRNRLVSSYTLLAAIGRMTAKSLALNVPVYNPNENYEDVKYKWIGTGINNDLK